MFCPDRYTSYALYRLPFADEVCAIGSFSDAGAALTDRAFIMLPFDESSHARIVITPDEEFTLRYDDIASADAPSSLTLSTDRSGYDRAFSAFHEAVQSRFPKLVLSRSVQGSYAGHPLQAFVRACITYPRTMVYLAYTPSIGYWIGSTPEILLSGSKTHYRTVALAGTMTSEGEWSQKNRREQAIVADYVRSVITPLSSVVEEEGPFTSHAGHLLHLKTEFHFTPRRDVPITEFIRRLQPTPAVCGLPKDEAQRFILAHEGYDRQYYSGVVGMYDPHGDTNLYVNLRCASILDGKATIYVGGGILPESTLESEYQETESKMQTICSVLRPTPSN
ncbi:MAG: chorismate-binding protein [Bacteroidaceae bacterium]|nr:chorismate-binding protein [Bacteroidaceae bacterium]